MCCVFWVHQIYGSFEENKLYGNVIKCIKAYPFQCIVWCILTNIYIPTYLPSQSRCRILPSPQKVPSFSFLINTPTNWRLRHTLLFSLSLQAGFVLSRRSRSTCVWLLSISKCLWGSCLWLCGSVVTGVIILLFIAEKRLIAGNRYPSPHPRVYLSPVDHVCMVSRFALLWTKLLYTFMCNLPLPRADALGHIISIGLSFPGTTQLFCKSLYRFMTNDPGELKLLLILSNSYYQSF